MNEMELLGAVCFVAVSLAFYAIRKRLFVYNLLCACVVVGFASLARRFLFSGEWLLMVAGLALYWFGMLTVRVILTRSVSLNLLASYQGAGAGPDIHEDIAGRLADGRRFHLIASPGGSYRLTWFGRLIAGIVAAGYVVLRIDR